MNPSSQGEQVKVEGGPRLPSVFVHWLDGGMDFINPTFFFCDFLFSRPVSPTVGGGGGVVGTLVQVTAAHLLGVSQYFFK